MNRVTYFIATVDNLLGKENGKTYNWRFGDIYYTKEGSGTPLLLIHDLTPYSSGYEWNEMVKQLSKEHTVYTIDLLGCGRSDKPDITYTNFLYVQLITDFIKNVIGEKTDVIATGESASFVVMACKNDDTVIDRIMMINPLGLTTLAQVPTRETKALKLLISIPLIGTLLYNILVSRKSIEFLFFTDLFYNPGNADDEYLKTYYETAHLDNGHCKYLFASLKGRYTKANIIPALKDINNSMYILSGAGDPENLLIAEQYKELVPSIESVDLEKVKTLPQMEAPELVLEQIKIFFNDIEDELE